MTIKIELGDQFSYLRVLSGPYSADKPDGSKARQWECECVCGRVLFVWASDLKSKRVKSCGCSQHSGQTKLTFNGETHCLKFWIDKLNLKRSTVYKRYHDGLSPERILSNER